MCLLLGVRMTKNVCIEQIKTLDLKAKELVDIDAKIGTRKLCKAFNFNTDARIDWHALHNIEEFVIMKALDETRNKLFSALRHLNEAPAEV